MKLFIGIIAFLSIILCIIYYFTGYRSAFEADQACHYQQWNLYGDSPGYGCDHDLETNQWILFEKGKDHSPAIVIRRFKY